ncbi:MAG TPA: multiubiquitin domain-containing protein [Burkholderiales bacterium]|nr:multiubiquitin domain-containing protein [Burkholderiales bacterium]
MSTLSSEAQSKAGLFHIVINGRAREVAGPTISYAQVVGLAFPNDPAANQSIYSVHYVGPHHADGTLAEGQSVPLENGLKFDVTKTNRS